MSDSRMVGEHSSTPPTWQALFGSPLYCFGVSVYVANNLLDLVALAYVPETTLEPLSAVAVVLNYPLAYAFLNERFSKVDRKATFACILSLTVAAATMPRNTLTFLQRVPALQVVDFCTSLAGRVEFQVYVLTWLLLLLATFSQVASTSSTRLLQPFSLSLRAGLFIALWHFMGPLTVSFLRHSGEHHGTTWRRDFWAEPCTYIIVAACVGSFVLSTAATCEGLRYLDCRFFVPASFAVSTVLVGLQELLIFQELQQMSCCRLVAFACACLAGVACVFFISPRQHARLPLGAPLSLPLLDTETDQLERHKAVLEIIFEHNTHRRESRTARPLAVHPLHKPAAGKWALTAQRTINAWLPLTAVLGSVTLLAVLWTWDCMFSAFALLTAFGLLNGWKFGAQMALFSYVGQKKMAHYEAADFEALYRAEIRAESWRHCESVRPLEATESPSTADACRPMEWEDVVHVVFLPNYTEAPQILQMTLRSIATSKIARRQICVVLAMEEREKGCQQKAVKLCQEFAGMFREVITTYHPSNLPDDPPGKSSNMRWSANQLFDIEMPRLHLDMSRVVLTVSDADSEFHPEYFSALTYHFLRAGGSEGETPDRYLSIWQPPMVHYKNYLDQPVLVRLASLFCSQHELANLADPNATVIPYSTFSISAELAKAVDGWDPDWISDDWHMGLKCFLATAGRFRIKPIFLAVMNYSPEGEGTWQTFMARWSQAKRHALGFSELLFFQEHFPVVFASLSSWRRRAEFAYGGFFLWFKMFCIHMVMSTLVVAGPSNGLVILYFYQHHLLQFLNSWTFLANCVFQCLGLISFAGYILTNVLLSEHLRSRIEGGDKPDLSLIWRSRTLHYMYVMATSLAVLPIFAVLGGAAEWIAAVKCTRSHVFYFKVSLKKNLSSLRQGDPLSISDERSVGA